MKERKVRFRRYTSIFFSLGVITAFFISTSQLIHAAAGGLDNTLDGNGKLATDFNNGTDIATDVLIQPDGKIVVAGRGNVVAFQGAPVIARYNVDGSLDTTFGGGDGKVELAGFCSRALIARDVFGRIIVATCEYSPTTPYNLFIYRLTTAGIVDTTFDTDGRIEVGFLPENVVLADVTTDSSGKILVASGNAGNIPGGGNQPIANWILRRFNTNGSPDTGFNGSGIVVTDFGGNVDEYPVGITVLSNGKIIVGGSANPGTRDFGLALYTTNGSLDTSWGGGDGKVVTDLTTMDVPTSMKVAPDGKIVIAGNSTGPSGQTPTLLRYNADGTLDNTFDNDGSLQDATLVNIQSMAIQFDGKIVTVGKKLNATNDFIVARRNLNGSADTSFGTGGVVTTDMNNGSDDDAKTVAIQVDRRIVVAGSTLNTVAGSTTNFCVARYLPTNRLYRAPFDFDGDGKSDHGIFRPSNGQWWINRSSTNTTPVFSFGTSTDRIAPADFTGDGKADVALFRPSTGEWYILRSENFSFYAFPFGANGDVPVPGDFDADGKADPAVYRPSSSVWYISQSGGSPTQIVQFGIAGDQPVVADYDEDGRADVGIFRPGPREWWIARSTAGTLALQFGNTGDKPVQGDFTGDGKADVALFRPSNGEWYVVRSEDNSFFGFPFGTTNDVPAPADYDGDGRMDPTVVRGTQWFSGRSNGGTSIFGFGSAGDRPIPNAFVP